MRTCIIGLKRDEGAIFVFDLQFCGEVQESIVAHDEALSLIIYRARAQNQPAFSSFATLHTHAEPYIIDLPCYTREDIIAGFGGISTGGELDGGVASIGCIAGDRAILE